MTVADVKPGDIVEIDGPRARGGNPAQSLTRYHASVVDNPGDSTLSVRRLNTRADAPNPAFPVKAYLVIGVWRRTKATARRAGAA